MDESKNNNNLLNFDKSGTEEIALSTFEDSDAISQKDSCHRDSFVEPIEKEESSNFTQSVKIPVQTEATSADKSEKSKNSEAFLSASYKW